jgi:hypothetical protein
MTHDTIDLRDLVDALIDDRESDEYIDPAAIAAAALAKLGDGELRRVADLYIRQLARAACRRRFGRSGDDEADGPDPNQGEMFPEDRFPGLQRRYPEARSDRKESTYVLRDSMGAADVDFNVKRLRKEGTAKLEHAETLQDWWVVRQASAAVSPAA